MTNNVCYVTAATPVTCTRKRRAVITDVLDTPTSKLEIDPDTSESVNDDLESSLDVKKSEAENSEREARLMSGLLYWITTTTTSTTTSYTATLTIGSVFCTPAGATLCG